MFSSIFKPKPSCDEILNLLEKIRDEKCNPFGNGYFREGELDVNERKECVQAITNARNQLEKCIKEEIASGRPSKSP